MALFLDVHHKVDGLTADAVSGAHQRDLEVQGKYGVDYKQYSFDEASGRSSAWSRRPTPMQQPPCTARPMAWWPTRSCPSAPDPDQVVCGPPDRTTPRSGCAEWGPKGPAQAR